MSAATIKRAVAIQRKQKKYTPAERAAMKRRREGTL